MSPLEEVNTITSSGRKLKTEYPPTPISIGMLEIALESSWYHKSQWSNWKSVCSKNNPDTGTLLWDWTMLKMWSDISCYHPLLEMVRDSSSLFDPLVFKDGFLLMMVGAKVYICQIEANLVTEVCSIPMLSGSSMERLIVVSYSLSSVPLKST